MSLLLSARGLSQPILDQQQLTYNGGMSARTQPGDSVWQSFTAGVSGQLVAIDMGFFNFIDGSATLRIYDGWTPFPPNLKIGQYAVHIFSSSDSDMTWDSWSVSVPIVQGQRYTFEIIPDPFSIPDPYGVALSASGNYEDGALGETYRDFADVTDFDMVFMTYVEEMLLKEKSHYAGYEGLFS